MNATLDHLRPQSWSSHGQAAPVLQSNCEFTSGAAGTGGPWAPYTVPAGRASAQGGRDLQANGGGGRDGAVHVVGSRTCTEHGPSNFLLIAHPQEAHEYLMNTLVVHTHSYMSYSRSGRS